MNIINDRARRLFASAALVAAASLISTQPARAGAFEPPPLADQPSTEHHVGKMVWAELITPDLARAEHFYAGLFGWTFRDMSTGDFHYAVAMQGGDRVAGLLQHPVRTGEKRQPAWLTFLSVQDVDAATHAAVGHGGRIVREPRTYDSRGRQAILADPQGAVFAVIASYSGDPGDYLAPPGAWIWSSVLARDADTDAAFYQTVFGYDAFDIASDDGRDHVILSSDDYARASVNSLPADAVHRRPHWLNFVRVMDTAETATRAVALGGSVLVAPRLDRHGGRLAVIADPTGAPFGVMEWTDTDSKEEPK